MIQNQVCGKRRENGQMVVSVVVNIVVQGTTMFMMFFPNGLDKIE
jgi:hypothetical protein